ncbi:monocarboxylate transporter 12-like [Glandiceps talaboti]
MSDASTTSKDTTPPEGGWGWFIVLGTFINTAFGAGSFYSFGVLYVAFLDAFGESKAATSIIASIYGIAFVMMGSVGLALSKRFGHRKTVMFGGVMASVGLFTTSFVTTLQQVYVTYGFVTGASLGLTVVPSVDMIGMYFKKRLSIAVGIAMAGTGAGQFTLSLVTQFFVEVYGWRGSMVILSAIAAHVCVAGALLRPYKEKVSADNQRSSITTNGNLVRHKKRVEETSDFVNVNGDTYNHIENGSCIEKITRTKAEVDSRTQNQQKKSNCLAGVKSFMGSLYDVSLFKEPVFQLILVTAICQGVGHGIVTVHISRRAIDFGTSTSLSSLIPAVMGLSQLVGRPVVGAMANLQNVQAYTIYVVAMAICGVSTIVSTYTRHFEAQVVYVILFGIGLGGYIILVPVVVAEFLGAKRMGHGLSVTIQVQGIVILFAGPLSGWMRDTSGIYDGAFWLSGVALVVGAIVALFIPVVHKFVQRRHQKRTYDTIVNKEPNIEEMAEVLHVAECLTAF